MNHGLNIELAIHLIFLDEINQCKRSRNTIDSDNRKAVGMLEICY